MRSFAAAMTSLILSRLTVGAAIVLMPVTAAQAQVYTLSTLAVFNNANGAYPVAGLVMDSSGNLYGTTSEGGNLSPQNNNHGYGTVFKIDAATGTLTTLAAFDGTNGATPLAPLIMDSSGNLYGTTQRGGPSDSGTVFTIAAGTNTITTLASFNGANGSDVRAGLTRDSLGNLYGTTTWGGPSGLGTVYKIAAGTNTITTLASFNGLNGQFPQAGLTLDSAGNLYGTTMDTAGSNPGTVFRVAAGTNALTTIATFPSNAANGAFPGTGYLAIDSFGNLFGTTNQGGAGTFGTVFKVAAGTSTITTLASFNEVNGANPVGSVILDSVGNLYGTTAAGGEVTNSGTVFKIAAGTNTLTTLSTFVGFITGSQPYGDLLLDSSGNLYGTTSTGGANGYGTVFKLMVNGAVAAAPEPATLALVATGLLPVIGAMVRAGRRREKG